MLLEQIERKQKQLQRLYRTANFQDALKFAKGPQGSAAADSKTVGVRIPPAVRVRLDELQKRFGLQTTKQIVLLTIHLGIQQLEATDE